MTKNQPHSIKSPAKKRATPPSLWRVFRSKLRWTWETRLRRIITIFVAFIVLWVSGMYGIAQWYTIRHADEPLEMGVTFIPNYARFFDLDPQETMDAIIDELGVKHFRLVSYWKDIEKTPGVYNFDELDWQFEKVNQAGGTVSLAIGLRQPRWPECHMPTWAEGTPMSEWAPKLKVFMGQVVDRYKDNPALKSYQLENEFFMSVFGICPDFTRERLVDEFEFVKALDPNTPIIVSRSNNWVGVPIGDPRPDQTGISVYKRVWDKTITKRYFEYPLPAWFYGFLAGAGEIATGRTMIIHELQAESWTPEGMNIKTASLEEQNKSMNAKRLADRFDYAKATGIRSIDFWGVEWWYWRKVAHDDPSLWNVARDEFAKERINSLEKEAR